MQLESILEFFSRLTPVTKPFKLGRVRYIRTVGCQASDGPTKEGTIVRKIVKNCRSSNANGIDLEFFVVQFDDGSTKDLFVVDCFKAADGVYEYRD